MPQSHHLLLTVIAASVLIAIAAVLISPAVPSDPTLLPVSGLVLVGIIVLAAHAIVGTRHVLSLSSPAEGIELRPKFPLTSAGRPLRC